MTDGRDPSLERFVENVGFYRDGDPICNLGILLNVLGVSGKPLAVKKAAVAEWLKSNNPVGLLPFELEDEGYI